MLCVSIYRKLVLFIVCTSRLIYVNDVKLVRDEFRVQISKHYLILVIDYFVFITLFTLIYGIYPFIETGTDSNPTC